MLQFVLKTDFFVLLRQSGQFSLKGLMTLIVRSQGQNGIHVHMHHVPHACMETCRPKRRVCTAVFGTLKVAAWTPKTTNEKDKP